jgi:ATP-dependent protease ClpP protease subunit
MNKKFYEFKNITSSEADLFVYGEIVQEKSVDWWTGEESQTDVGLMDFKEQLDSIGNVQKLNLYINSPGGDVFTASTMISMLKRVKDKGTTINAYVDGLSASAASFLMMVADNVNLYKNSTVMIHKPMSWAVGNANDMQKTIDALNKIEESVMMPMYMSKSKVSEEEIKSLIDAETWLSAKEMDKYFNVTLLDEEKTAVASISSNLFKNYKNVPDFIKNSLKTVQNDEKIEENAQKPGKPEEIEENEPVSSENTPENSENEPISTENQSKEEEIKARLKMVNISLKLKDMKEGEDK